MQQGVVKNFGLILPVVKKMVQPRATPVAGGAEANALSYAAQRGKNCVSTAFFCFNVVFYHQLLSYLQEVFSGN